MPTLVGDDRVAAVDRLVARFDDIASGDGPRVVSLESPLGLGKTRLVQELFARLAVTRQEGVAYWPPALVDASVDDLLRTRKQVEPTPGWVIPGNAEIPWLWWGIACQRSNAGTPMRALKDAGDQLRAHLVPLQARLEAADHRGDDALDLLAGVFHLVGVFNPAAAMDTAGSKFVEVWRRRRKRRRALQVAMDRRVESSGASYEEAADIAKGLTAVAHAGTPLVLVVDDAQWADPALVSLLRHLVGLDKAPVLIVTTVWPDKLAQQEGPGAATFATWFGETASQHPGRLERISLAGLRDEDLGRLVAEVAPRTDDATVSGIAALASGNPLVLNLLLNLDVLRHDVRVDGRIDTDPLELQRLPSELRAIYQDLWRQLPEPVRRVLALAALQGPEFLPGFVSEAAVQLGMYDELVPALAAARDLHGWVRPVNEDRYQFSERQRFEIASEIVDEVFSPEQQDTIRRAAVDHVRNLKASPRWSDLDPHTRRVALESHLDLNEQLGEDVERDLGQVGDSMVRLAALELDVANLTAAVNLAEGGYRLLVEVGADEDDVLAAKTLLGDALANADRIDEAVPLLADVIAEAAPSEEIRVAEVAELIEELEEDQAPEPPLDPAVEVPSDSPPRAGSTGPDEWGRVPFESWTPRPVPRLDQLAASDVADLIVEVVATEGPTLARRVYDVLRSASGASRQGRLIRTALNRGVRAALRRGDVVASVADARGDSGRRVLRLPSQPEVRLRYDGDRDASAIPRNELVELARRVLAREPALGRVELKRRMGRLLGFTRYTRALDSLLEDVLPASLTAFGQAESSEPASGTSGVASDPGTAGGPPDEGGPRWHAAYEALVTLQPGEWTSIADLAAIVGTSSGWMARHLYTRQDLAGLHRMLNRDGSPWRHLEDSGSPRHPDDVRRQLEGEGVHFDAQGRASGDQRVSADRLRARLDGNAQAFRPGDITEAPSSGESAASRTDWELAYRALASLGRDEWTSFAEVATIAGTTPAWVARHMYRHQQRPGVERLLNRDGTPWKYLEDPAGARRDPAHVRKELEAEGLQFDREGRALESHCVRAEVLRKRLES